ncbi:MAG: dynamin family protein [Prolixibacteraceae bacterium]|nr:dynamin family protein [Prolixibacteraceae bacterium]
MNSNYFDAINTIQAVCNRHGFDKEVIALDEINNRMQLFTVKVMFTGGFSTGKSSAINIFLGDEILKENQTPETAIACELLYDEEEYIEAIKDGVSTRYEIYDSSEISPREYDYVIRHINNERIKSLDGITIVDMPGFNSGIEAHNKAILRYAGMGNAYILTIDCEDGEIKESISEFLNEIKNYDNNIAILVTKADKKDSSALAEIINNIAESASNIFFNDIKVEPVSKFIDGSDAKILKLLKSFDISDIHKQVFSPAIYEIGTRCIFGLSSMKKALHLDDTGLSEEIKIRTDNKTRLEKQFEEEKRRLSAKMKNSVRPEIISDVSNALYAQSDSLATALLAGGANFSTMVNNILRSVLISSTRKYVEQSFDEFVSNLDVSMFSATENYGDININPDEINSKLSAAKNVVSTIVEDSQSFGGVYKAISTALAVTTSVVAPWLELILIFLPDIIKAFSAFNERKAKEEANARAKTKVTSEIIPQIISKLEPEIDKSLDEMQSQMIDDVAESFRQRIDFEIECLNATKEKLNASKHEYDEKIQEIDSSIATITKAINSL